MPWMMFRAPVEVVLSCRVSVSEAAVSGQRLNVLREGFDEHGEGWLRGELAKHNTSSTCMGSLPLRACSGTQTGASFPRRSCWKLCCGALVQSPKGKANTKTMLHKP